MSDVPEKLRAALAKAGQSHVLQFWTDLTEPEKKQLLAQLQAIDLELINELIELHEEVTDWSAKAQRAEPPKAIRIGDPDRGSLVQEAIALGEAALRDDQVAVVIVAGGQGTRLGFDQPKGCFPIGPVSGRTLFQVLFDTVAARRARYQTKLPVLIMTSPATDVETRHYLEANDYLGLDPATVHVFCQGTMPAVDRESGKLLMDSRSSLALSPDGHGGMLAALDRSGLLSQLQRDGIRYLYYCQVDNPLAQIAAPELLGFHIRGNSELTTQVVRKVDAQERVGNVVDIDGRLQIIEYSDLPDSAATRTDSDGQLTLWAGNIAIHVFNLEFLNRIKDQRQALPFHRANKKVPFVDASGTHIEPSDPNGIKFERFIFDLLPHAENALAVEANKADAFAPVKNANGAAADTPEAAQQAMVELAKSWLESLGCQVAPNVTVEINPRYALDVSELSKRLKSETAPPERIDEPTYWSG